MKRLNLSIGQRLTIGSAIVALLIVALGVVVAVSTARITTQQREQSDIIAPRARAAVQLETAVYQQAVALRTYGLSGSNADLETFGRTTSVLARRIEQLADLPKTAAGQAIFDEMVPLYESHQQSIRAVLERLSNEGDRDLFRAAEADIAMQRARLLEKVSSYADLQAQLSDAAAQSVSQATANLFRSTIVVTLLILIASVLTGFVIARSVRQPALRLKSAAEAMRRGVFQPALALQENDGDDGETSLRDELREAAHGFGAMAATLKAREERLSAHARLSAVLVNSLDPREVAAGALGEMTRHLLSEIGAVYLCEESQNLLPLASIALEGELSPLRIGAGIPGHAAATRVTTVMRDIPRESPFLVRLGFDALPPRCVVSTPMIVKDRLVGVIVIGGLRDLDDEAVRFTEQAAGQLAIALDNALAHRRIAALASDLQDKNEVLQLQNEELQAQSEELQAQSEELQAQSEELQAQGEELQAQNEELMVQTGELNSQTEELRSQREVLQQITKELGEADTQKNRFLAVLGHELRNPLAAIRSAVPLLNRPGSDSDDTAAQAHTVVERQTAHLGRLLDDLLDVGRITSGKIVLERRSLPLAPVVERCVSSLSTTTGPLICVQIDDAVCIDADETRVEQIIMNLLTNAVKFTPAGGMISLRLGRDESRAVLEVSDTGAGIEPELLPRIFDFFIQGTHRPPGGNGGLGVGLALARHLVELHGGTIEARSAGPGEGTTVTVRFPCLAVTSEIIRVPVPDAKLPLKRSVVVVEDNADLRQMMRLLLKRAGHAVEEAHDGPTGVEVVRAIRPDVALVDLDLPGFDGCEVARRLRQDTLLDGVRLIAVSGYGSPEDRARAIAAGFDDHLVKPVDFEHLSETLQELRGRVV
jgi:signal transduction histidine kinase/CHASE3 domain sensor protein